MRPLIIPLFLMFPPAPMAPMAPKPPKAPMVPKPPKAPMVPKPPKAPAPMAPKPPKAPMAPKPPKAPMAPKPPKAPMAPKPQVPIIPIPVIMSPCAMQGPKPEPCQGAKPGQFPPGKNMEENDGMGIMGMLGPAFNQCRKDEFFED